MSAVYSLLLAFWIVSKKNKFCLCMPIHLSTWMYVVRTETEDREVMNTPTQTRLFAIPHTESHY